MFISLITKIPNTIYIYVYNISIYIITNSLKKISQFVIILYNLL